MQTKHILLVVIGAGALLGGPNWASALSHHSPAGFTLSSLGATNGQFAVRVDGPSNRVYRVEASADLVNWSALATNLTGRALVALDPAAKSYQRRFYRASANPEMHAPGQEVLALQGLRSNTLVAGKTTALRLFTDELTYSAVDRIEAAIVRPDGLRVVKTWSRADIVTIPTSSQGRSLVVRVAGADLPWVGGYYVDAKVFDSRGGLLAGYSIDQAQLLPTKDLRVMVHRVWAGSINPGSPAEIQAAADAMERLAWAYPVRDGISALNGDRNAGLRYLIDNNASGPPCQDCDNCTLFGGWLNRPSSVDSIDVAIQYRFPDPSEGCGANSPHICPNQTLKSSLIVWQAPLAQGFCHETGHNFGLEPAEDPHFDSTGQAAHSKDYTIDALDAGLGFDNQFNQPFPSQTYDIMYPTGPCPGWTPSLVSLNAWDWEYLRKKFLLLPSTGPTLPKQFTTDAAPAVAGLSDTAYLVAKRSDGRIFYNRAPLGQDAAGWKEIEGGGRTDAAPAVGAVGTHLFVAVKGLDGNIYLNQADVGQSFGQWFPMNFTTDVAPAVSGVGSNVYVFARSTDGRIFYNRAQLGQAFVGWAELQGNGRTDAAPAAGAVGTHVFVAIKGLDGNLYMNQADLAQPFGQWFPMNFASDAAPAVCGDRYSVYVFAKSNDSRIFFNRAQLGQAFVGWAEVQGNGRTDKAPGAGAFGSRVFVAAKGLDGRVYVNQEDQGAFAQWENELSNPDGSVLVHY